jgi:hypothetical protein
MFIQFVNDVSFSLFSTIVGTCGNFLFTPFGCLIGGTNVV